MYAGNRILRIKALSEICVHLETLGGGKFATASSFFDPNMTIIKEIGTDNVIFDFDNKTDTLTVTMNSPSPFMLKIIDGGA